MLVPVPELNHPFVFGVVALEVAALVIFLHLGAVSWLSYRGTGQRELRVHALWCFWAAMLAVCFFTLNFQFPPIAYTVAMHGMSIAGPLAMKYYMLAVGRHLALRDPWLDRLQRWQPLACIWPLASLFALAVGLEQFFLFERSAPPNGLLIQIVHRSAPVNEVHPVFAVGLLLMLIADLTVLLRGAMRAPRRDRLVLAGIVITCACVAYEVIAMKVGLRWAMPTIFAANVLEAVRITYVSTVEIGRNKVLLEQRSSELGHELRTPFASARLFLDRARRKGELNAQAVASLDKLEQSLEQASAVLAGFDVAANDSMTRCSLENILARATDLCAKKIDNAQVEVEIVPECEVWGRHGDLVQVFANLIDNAADAVAGEPDAWIRLAATTNDGIVAIEVTDSGEPPPPSIQQRMFDKSFTTKRARGGRGVGLGVVQRIVRESGGDVKFEAAAPHTTFRVRLPMPPTDRRRVVAAE